MGGPPETSRLFTKLTLQGQLELIGCAVALFVGAMNGNGWVTSWALFLLLFGIHDAVRLRLGARSLSTRVHSSRLSRLGEVTGFRIEIDGLHSSWEAEARLGDGEWGVVDEPATLTSVVDRRGSYDSVHVQLRLASWLGRSGLIGWTVAPLNHPLLVLPRPARSLPPEVRRGDHTASGELGGGRTGEDYSVREYRQGDPRRLVHWPLTAAAGTLIVRTWHGRCLELDLGLLLNGTDQTNNSACARAETIAAHVLQGGGEIVLNLHWSEETMTVGDDRSSSSRQPLEGAHPELESIGIDSMTHLRSLLAQARRGPADDLQSGKTRWVVRADGHDEWAE